MATREVKSSVSVEIGVLEAWELRETELSEGESKLVFRECCCACWCCLAATAGDRFLPLPSTLPPPSDLRAAMIVLFGEFCPWSSHVDEGNVGCIAKVRVVLVWGLQPEAPARVRVRVPVRVTPARRR